MKYLFFSASFLCLAACGGETMSPEQRAAYDAKCGVIEKIIAARDDTPAFASLTAEDVPPGATGCVSGNDPFYPAEAWLDHSETIRVPVFVCTYETSPSTDPHSQTRVDFSALSKRVTDCLGGWDKLGIGGVSEDGLVHSAGYQYSQKNDPGYPGLDGGFYAPISYAWLLSADPDRTIEGQRIMFYVLGK